jgi:5-oxopent-3-ene-1,2,5-tricarboxylate decarboxylase / 2-hydroxyhepta-2,4-diene-1,7-dioate isomerase
MTTDGGEMAQATRDEMIERLEAIPTASICDAYLKAGTYPPERVVMRRLRPLGSLQQRAVGRARTQQLVSRRDKARGSVVANRALHFELVDGTKHGDFLIVAVAGTDLLASFGDILALKAKAMGATGIAVDGPIRDAAFMERLELPVWCDGITMVPQGYGGYSVESVDQPVTCAGVEVQPGDFVVADGDGVIVVPAAEAETIVQLAEDLEADEEHARVGIAEGARLEALYPSRDYYKTGSEKEER